MERKWVGCTLRRPKGEDGSEPRLNLLAKGLRAEFGDESAMRGMVTIEFCLTVRRLDSWESGEELKHYHHLPMVHLLQARSVGMLASEILKSAATLIGSKLLEI